ncbi:MAG TPA: sugar transferase [Thermoanaerobaculia bacterium]|nr:sugar transferase [Thermoanaerobaculia bacterium]
MLKQQARSVAASLYAADLTSTLGALAAAYLVRSELLPRFFPERLTPLYPFTWYLVLVGPVVVIWTGLLFLAGAYRSRRTSGLKDEALLVGKIVLGGTVLLTILVYGLRLDFISRPFLPLFAVLNTVFLVVERLTVRIVARRVRARGFNYRTVVIIGDTPRARSMARLIHDHPWWGLRLLGVVRERPASSEAGTTAGGLPVLGSLEDFPTILTSLPVDEVILAVDRGDVDQLEDVFLMCEEMGVKTRLILDFFPHVFAKVELEEFDGTPLLTFSTTPAETGALLVKRVVDVGLALLLGIVCLPLAALLALLIKLTSHGPVLFRQVRCGLSGRPFTFYKLRTMTEDAEERLSEVAHLNEHEGPVFKSSHDPRVTPFGRFLRRFSLDEIPQLWNVLKGEMSLVGPRPPLPDEVARYEKWQRRRLSMKPGLTGLWQVSGRSDLPSFDQWMELDLAYIDNWSLTLDTKILLRTIPTVLSGKGAR